MVEVFGWIPTYILIVTETCSYRVYFCVYVCMYGILYEYSVMCVCVCKIIQIFGLHLNLFVVEKIKKIIPYGHFGNN